MKNIIIIGANGFTGRQILNDLSSKAQYKVTGCSLHPDILPKNGGNYSFHHHRYDGNEASVKYNF